MKSIKYFRNLLIPLASACGDLSYDPQNHLDLATSYLSILYHLTPSMWNKLLSSISDNEKKNNFFQFTFSTIWKLLSGTYPPHWFTMWIFTEITLLKIIQSLSPYLKKNISTIDSHIKIWLDFFKLCLKFINLRSLRIELFSPSQLKKFNHLFVSSFIPLRLFSSSFPFPLFPFPLRLLFSPFPFPPFPFSLFPFPFFFHLSSRFFFYSISFSFSLEY